jgi:hypothetical protein
MIEVDGDIWAYEPAEYICIPTNGQRRMDGSAIMGAGLARAAAEECPGLAAHLGKMLKYHGNHVINLGLWKLKTTSREVNLIAFPTKGDWRHDSTPILVERSAKELAEDFADSGIIALPRVGTGNGGLAWSVVKPLLEAALTGDSFVVVNRA